MTIGADDSIEKALRTLIGHKVRRLPVIDGRQLVGIISQADVATTVDEERVGDVVEAISAALWWGGCGLVLARPVAWLGARLSRQTGRIARLLFAMCPTTEFSPDGPDWRRAPGVAHWFDPRRKPS